MQKQTFEEYKGGKSDRGEFLNHRSSYELMISSFAKRDVRSGANEMELTLKLELDHNSCETGNIDVIDFRGG